MRPFEVVSASDGLPQRQVSARGDLDMATAGTLLAAVRAVMVQPGAAGLRLDLSGITFIDSVGISVLIQIHRIAAETGGLDISCSSAVVLQVLL